MDISLIPFWNKKNLSAPSVNCLKIISESPDKISAHIAETLEHMISCLSNLGLLHCDAALISRLLYRNKKTLRSHKGYKCFQKVRHCLSSYLTLDFLSTVTELRNTSYGTYGPNKEALEWCLVSLQRFSALFHRLQATCFESAYFMHNHIVTGNTWHLAVMFLACISRVWTISRYLCTCACEWYLQLKSFLPHLETTEPWLPDGYELPLDLKSWLGNPIYLASLNKEKTSVKTSKDDHVAPTIHKGLVFNEDLGEIISNVDESTSSDAKESKISFEKFEDISNFIKTEQNLRQTKNVKSKTKNLSESEWKYLKNYLKKSFIELKSARDQRILYESLHRAQEKLNSWLKK